MALSSLRPLRERLAGLLPLLCLIHCVGTAVVAAAMPAAALWMRNEWLEGALTLISALLIGSQVLRRGADSEANSAPAALYVVAIVLAAIGWLYDLDWLRHGSLLLFVSAQLVWLRARGRRPRVACECATHDAGHRPAVALAPARD